MKTRNVVIFTGQRFRVPENIQRLDSNKTHGWQLRYGKSKMFSDFSNDGTGAKAALQRAVAELKRRVATMPAPSGLQREPSANKSSDLPVGISGPIVRYRKGRSVPECSFGVSLPVFGGKSRRSTVYIGSQNTYTQERYDRALATAVEMRRKAEEAYQEAATKAKRAAVRKL